MLKIPSNLIQKYDALLMNSGVQTIYHYKKMVTLLLHRFLP